MTMGTWDLHQIYIATTMPSQKQAKAIQAHHQIKPNPLKSKPKKPPKSIIFAFFLVVEMEMSSFSSQVWRNEREW